MRSINTSRQSAGCAFNCPAIRALNQSTPRNARWHRKSIKPMVNAIDPIASIVRRKLSPHPVALRTNPRAHDSDVTCASCIKISTLNPTFFRTAVLNRALPHIRRILLRQNCLAQTGLARNGHSLLHCSFVHSPSSLRTGPDYGQG
jgi:hypothetical protein